MSSHAQWNSFDEDSFFTPYWNSQNCDLKMKRAFPTRNVPVSSPDSANHHTEAINLVSFSDFTPWGCWERTGIFAEPLGSVSQKGLSARLFVVSVFLLAGWKTLPRRIANANFCIGSRVGPPLIHDWFHRTTFPWAFGVPSTDCSMRDSGALFTDGN